MIINICNAENEAIRLLCKQDIANRATYGDIPTRDKISDKMYEDLVNSPCYHMALDYVICEKSTNKFTGFCTWWIDKKSSTALLEPVACLPEFRRRGIMQRALLHGLNELKNRGISFAYVGTSIRNDPAKSLYLSVGFNKIGTSNSYTKELKSK